MTNALRHAAPKHVTVTLDSIDSDASLALTVIDDGHGMTEPAPEGFGIRGMKERVAGLGGRYHVDSAIGRGTSVRIAIPLGEGGVNS